MVLKKDQLDYEFEDNPCLDEAVLLEQKALEKVTVPARQFMEVLKKNNSPLLGTDSGRKVAEYVVALLASLKDQSSLDEDKVLRAAQAIADEIQADSKKSN